jgi:hypothetical protein
MPIRWQRAFAQKFAKLALSFRLSEREFHCLRFRLETSQPHYSREKHFIDENGHLGHTIRHGRYAISEARIS